jgi:hypothetical protein
VTAEEEGKDVDTDDIPAEALAGAALGAALTAVVLDPRLGRAVRWGAVLALGRLLALKDAAHASLKDLIQDAGVAPAEAERAADVAEDVAGTAATTLGTP